MPQQGTSNEYPQHMFLCRNKKNGSTFRLKKKLPYLEVWYKHICVPVFVRNTLNPCPVSMFSRGRVNVFTWIDHIRSKWKYKFATSSAVQSHVVPFWLIGSFNGFSIVRELFWHITDSLLLLCSFLTLPGTSATWRQWWMCYLQAFVQPS